MVCMYVGLFVGGFSTRACVCLCAGCVGNGHGAGQAGDGPASLQAAGLQALRQAALLRLLLLRAYETALGDQALRLHGETTTSPLPHPHITHSIYVPSSNTVG